MSTYILPNYSRRGIGSVLLEKPYFAGTLLCSGHKDDDSVIDIIDPENWTLLKRIDLPQDAWKSTLGREGMAFDGNLYLLPDDGPDSRILIFALH